VRSWIVRTEVSFNFHDASGEKLAATPPDQHLAQQFVRHEAGIPSVEGAAQWANIFCEAETL
jgi:hypothetical protein